MARQFRCPRPINRLVTMRSRGLSGPFFQAIGDGFCVHTPGAYINAFGEGITLIGQFLVPDPDHIMTGVLLGEGDLTVSRAASVDIPDADGTDQTFGTSEAAWGGGRVTGAVDSRVVYDTDSEGVEYADPPWLAISAGDSHTLDSANINDYQGALYVEVYMAGDDNLVNGFLYRDTGNLTMDDGTNTVTAAISADEWHEVGIAWSTVDAQMDLLLDGTWIGAVAYDGSILSGALDLFRDAANGGRMRNLRIYSDGSAPTVPALNYTFLPTTPPLTYTGVTSVADNSKDPWFVDPTRDLAAWDLALGGPGTAANAISEMLKVNQAGFDSNYTPQALVAWVRGGFAPQKASIGTDGRNGDLIGAVEVSA